MYEESDIIRVGDIEIDVRKVEVKASGAIVSLVRKEFELLCFLAYNPDIVRSREEIINKVRGSEVVVGSRTIDVHVSKLRDKLGGNCIRTVKGMGNRFNRN